jgi:hypothetical protein
MNGRRTRDKQRDETQKDEDADTSKEPTAVEGFWYAVRFPTPLITN